MNYFSMILIGLDYLHSKQIIHRDLKPDNLLMEKLPSGDEILLIGDFGISKKDLQNLRTKDTLKELTTPAYMAPETIAELPSTKKVDMWALGVILYELSAGRLPFEGSSKYLTLKLISESEPAPLPSTVSPFIKQIIAKLLDKNPEARPHT
jgi:serine/threonine protein kinase